MLFLKIRITCTDSWLPCKWLGVDVKPHAIHSIQSSFNGSQKLLIQSMGVWLSPILCFLCHVVSFMLAERSESGA
jgi:hypothetical protein